MSAENETSSSERLWGAIGHWLGGLGVFPLPLINVAGPLCVFLMERTESKFAAFHAKQSFYLQVVVEVAVWIGIIVGLAFFSLIGALFGFRFPMWFSYLVVALWYAIRVVAALYAVLGGVKVYQGSSFEYVLVGQFARKH